MQVSSHGPLRNPIGIASRLRGHAAAICSTVACITSLSSAQPTHVEFKHLTVADGLSHSQVNAIVQDHQGFIWFGTRAGLDRHDGYQCRSFTHNPGDSTSLSGSFILSLLATRDRKLWIGTQGKGLDCYDPFTGEIRVYYLDGSARTANLVYLLEDSKGNVWAGTTYGLFRVVRDSLPVRFEPFPESLFRQGSSRHQMFQQPSRFNRTIPTPSTRAQLYDSVSSQQRFQQRGLSHS